MRTTPTIPTLALPVFLCVLDLTGALPFANLTRVRRAAAITGRFVVGPNEVNTLWPKTGRSVVIPYSIAGGGFEEHEEALIRFAARYWSERTCIDWTEGLPVEHQVYITRGDGDKAHSTLGRRPDRFALEQEIHLGEDVHDEENDEWIQQPLTFQTVIHEMGHAMGLIHEHQRWDRDRWLTVTGTDHNYRLEPVDQTTTFGKPYDWGSVMHYPEDEHMKSKFPALKRAMGSMYGPSFMDLWTVNRLYRCHESCLNVPNAARCQNGGFPNPKNCQQCICPEGFAGTCNHLAAGDNGAPPDCSKAVFVSDVEEDSASDSWETLFGNVEAPAEHGHHRGPPACCYYHINVDGTTGGHVEVKLSTVTAPTCNENCMDGWVEFKTAGYEIGGP
ncbi:CBN-NAS-27 protein, partial [Aphelenchoides avenae]